MGLSILTENGCLGHPGKWERRSDLIRFRKIKMVVMMMLIARDY